MKAMTSYIQSGAETVSLSALMTKELQDNETEVVKYSSDNWSAGDLDKIIPILQAETNLISNSTSLCLKCDSVKGEDAMFFVYPVTGGQTKATDSITLTSQDSLSLIEAKYLIKYACKGPFGGPGSFKERISRKFEAMARIMVSDGEKLETLRILVVTEEQLPYSVNHIRALVDCDYPKGSFSDDGQMHQYVVCSSSSLRMMIDAPPVNAPNAERYLFFTL